MASLNRVMLIGKLGRDPELSHTPNGKSVGAFSIATTESWNDNGTWKEKTEWHRITVWGKDAENSGKYLSKGQDVYVEGRIETREWTDKKSGEKKYETNIIATKVIYLAPSGKKRGNTHGRSSAEPREFESVRDSQYQNSDDLPF